MAHKKTTNLPNVLYGFEKWLLLQGKIINYKCLETTRSGKYVDLVEDEVKGKWRTLLVGCSCSIIHVEVMIGWTCSFDEKLRNTEFCKKILSCV